MVTCSSAVICLSARPLLCVRDPEGLAHSISAIFICISEKQSHSSQQDDLAVYSSACKCEIDNRASASPNTASKRSDDLFHPSVDFLEEGNKQSLSLSSGNCSWCVSLSVTSAQTVGTQQQQKRQLSETERERLFMTVCQVARRVRTERSAALSHSLTLVCQPISE